MFYELDEIDKRIFERASDLTLTDYNIKDGKIDVQNIISMVEDLTILIDSLKEKLEEEEIELIF